MSLRLALALAALTACQAAPVVQRAASPPRRSTGGPVDLTAMRALLQRHSPTGHEVVTTFEALPTHFDYGGGHTVDVSHGRGFDDYFTDGAPSRVVDDMSTAVHEVYHAYADSMGYQLQVRARAPLGLGAEAVWVGGEPVLVPYVATYPARDMDATYPADARTSRYATYVSRSPANQSTQVDGVFGLLDELTAYYNGNRTLVDFWPWVRDEAPRDEQLLINYVARFHEMWVPYAEFKLFILHYLRHARDHHPEVYRALLANQGFRRGFAAVNDAYAALLASAGQLEPTVHAFARSHGVNAGLDAGQLTFDGRPFTIRDDAYPAVMRHLASPAYREILGRLR